MVIGRPTKPNENSSSTQEDNDASNKCNGTAEESGRSQEMSQATYQFLLEQMESLRKENCSLKAGLKSNTSHITKLESEASRMKDMVLMLGSPALSSTSVESEYTPSTQSFLSVKFHSDHTGGFMPEESSSNNLLDQNFLHANHGAGFANNFEKPVERKRRSDVVNMGPGSSSHHMLRQDNLPSPQAMYSQESFTPSPSNNFSDVIRNLLASMKEERMSTMKSLILEEQKKEFYMRKLKELTSRFDSDKFSKPSDEITLQLQHEIAKLKRTMEISLGSSEAMQERLDARLKHIQFLDSEISNLEKLSRKSDFSFSPVDNDFHRSSNTQAGLGDSGALCIRHGSFHRNGFSVTEISTQTSKWNIAPHELRKFEESQSLCDVTSRDASSALSPGRVTRSIQTILSIKPGYEWVKSKHRNLEGFEISPNRSTPPSWMDIKQRDSFDSLQSDFDDTASMHSFTTSLPRSTQSARGSKKDEVFVSLLAPSDREDITRRIIKMGETIDGCRTLKQLGYMRLIIQIMHDGSLLTLAAGPLNPSHSNSVPPGFLESVKSIRMSMSKVLWNIVNVTSETKSNRDAQIFQTLEFLRRYCELLFEFLTNGSNSTSSKPNATINNNAKKFHNEYDKNATDLSHGSESHKGYDVRSGLSIIFAPPIDKVTFIMKLAYDENIKRVINEYGGLYAIAELFILHYRCVTASDVARSKLGSDAPKSEEKTLQLLRRFVGFALINLTYGDIQNKTALIQMPGLIDTIVLQMALDSEEMQQVMALFVRNLCWQADEKCREILKKKDITCVFTKCALKAKREDTLKSLLSALWNLSGHCSENRHSICTVKGALAFLVSTLISRVPDIVESGGGILRNVSSVVATNNDYRAILREQDCLQILLKHLKSGSLTIVSNACGTLWNLSARNPQDQKLLRDLGAVPMLKSLTHSKHSVIAQGSHAALRNLLTHRPGIENHDRDEHIKPKNQSKRHGGMDLKEDEKGSIDQDFSQRLPLTKSNVSQRIMSPHSPINVQRHSLQEKSTFTPPSELEVAPFPNRNYPGSLGSLPYSEFGDNVQKQNPQAVKYLSRRNGSAFQDQYSPNMPGNQRINGGFSPFGNRMSSDVKIFNDKMSTNSNLARIRQNNGNRPQGALSLRDYFIMVGESKSMRSTTVPSQSKNSNGTPAMPVVQSQTIMRSTDPKSIFHADTKDFNDSFVKSPFQDGSQMRVPDVQKLLGQTRSPNVNKISNVIGTKCPEDLVMSLCNVEDDYGEDDGLVDYSLRFRDEHMTPGIRSPRTEEIYELEAHAGAEQSENQPENYIPNRSESIPPSAAANGPSAKSEGGLSALSSCVESTGSSIAARPDILKNFEKTVEADMKLHANLPALSSFNFQGEHKIDPSSILDGDDDKPTDFSALYSEEQLFETIEHESLGMVPYAPTKEEKFSLEGGNLKEPREKKGGENSKAIESKEEDDKFDTGAITPGRAYHYRSGRTSGIMTPRTPLEYETPMMFSRSSSLDSVSTVGSIHSSVTSGPTSRMMSGAVSPSHLPDSPSQSMPISPRRSPPPQIVASHPADVDQQKQDQMGLQHKKLLKNAKVSTPLKDTELITASPVERNQNKTVKFLLPGYVTSLPHSDELNVYKSEGAMSVMTTFSALTIDSSVKVQPMCENDGVILSQSNDGASDLPKKSSKKVNNTDILVQDDKADDGLPKEQVPVIGYVTSLPTSDEIMTFMHEGTLSPMTAFSEITCLKDDNDGFQKTTGSVFSVPHSSVSARVERDHSVASNKVSIPSRSSATGASAPQDSPTNQNVISQNGENLEKEPTDQAHSSLDNSENSKLNDVRRTPKGSSDAIESDSDDSLSSCSDDDDDLLQQCINQAIPKKVSRSTSKSSKHSSKSSKSSRSKEKTNAKQSTPSQNESPSRKNEERAKNNPSPVIPDKEKPKRVNIKQRIESANVKLNGISIVQYMDNLISPDDDNTNVQNISKPNAAKSKQVASNAENQSYSVKKKLKEDKKKEAEEKANPKPCVDHLPRVSSKVLPIEPPYAVQSKMRVNSYLKEAMTSYATEGTPIEMSRSTSLSNITIESDGADADNMISQLKTSNSVPDISLGNAVSTPTEAQPSMVDSIDIAKVPKETNSVSSDPHDSQDVLENLGKQIENMRIATVSSMMSDKSPGYTTSIPEVDEIKKYRAEGSICGATEFSALTVDSDTKIAPLQSNKGKIFPNSSHSKSGTNPNNTLPDVNTAEHKHGGPADGETSLRMPLPTQAPVWENESYIHPSGHYNDENDNLGMKEERHNYMNEDTPLYLSGGSLSSLEFGSDDDNDLLNECISSALPPEKVPLGQLYMGASAMTTNSTHASHSLRLYSHGAPDGKVDDSLVTNSNHGNMHFAVPSQVGQFQSYNQGFPSLARDQFSQLNGNIGSANLIRENHPTMGIAANRIAPSGFPATASYQAVTQPSDPFHHIPRQPVVSDAGFLMSPSSLGKRQDVVVGQSEPSAMPSVPTSNQRHTTVRAKNHNDRFARPVKKHSSNMHDVDSNRRRVQAARAVDSSSGSSASYRHQQRHRHLSSNSRSTDMCGCQASYSGPSSQSRRYNRGSASTSTSHLADDMRQSSRSRKKSTSKNSMRGGCDHNAHHHHHHPPKPTRSRNSAKNVYRPGIVQLYPPLKDMVGVLEGVASVAARGDKVVADRTQQYSMGEMSVKSSSSSLVRSATFINDNPSDILLENMSQEEREQYAARSSVSSRSQTQIDMSTDHRGRIQSASPHGSIHSLKPSSHASTFGSSNPSLKAHATYSTKPKLSAKQKTIKKKGSGTGTTKSKPKKVWSGIKKLLSPSDENSLKVKEEKKVMPDKGAKTPLLRRIQSSPAKPSKDASSKLPDGQGNLQPHHAALNKKKSSSSLSLTSSSDSNVSSSADSPPKNRQDPQPTPFGHLPKSPSVNALMRRQRVINDFHIEEESSVWRRANPSVSGIQVVNSVSSQQSFAKQSIENCNPLLEQDFSHEDTQKCGHPHDTTQPNSPQDSSQLSDQQKAPSFNSPSRTLSPRVIQEVAPFNYRPTQKRIQGEERDAQCKGPSDDGTMSHSCRQTPS